MGLLNKLGGRSRLLGNPVTRNIAKALVRSNIGGIYDVANAFRGAFQVSGYGVSFKYELGPRDAVGENLYWLGLKRLEPNALPLFIKHARVARGVLDIGANTGVYSLAACAANPLLSCFSWEPVPYLAKKLQRNISINGFGDRCEAREAAVGNSTGEASFYISDDTQMSSLSSEYAAGKGHRATETKVKIETIDGFVPGDRDIDLMKVDVEGHEANAFAGAIETIRRCRPKILFECLPETDPRPIESMLGGLGYSIYSLVSPEQQVKIASIETGRSPDHNYLAIR